MPTEGGHWVWRSPITAMAISVSLDVAWLRRAVLGILEGSGMGGGWDLEYRNSVALTAYPVPFTQVRLFELRGPKAFGHH